MITFYSILIALCAYVELSNKINTDNILNKIGICLIIVGAFIGIYSQCYKIAQPNNLIAYGVFLHYICELIRVRRHG